MFVDGLKMTTQWLQHVAAYLYMVTINFCKKISNFIHLHVLLNALGYAVAQLVQALATSRKVAGSIPDGIIGIFH
jgi:hypothetical protein